jgi:hypothetical protein
MVSPMVYSITTGCHISYEKGEIKIQPDHYVQYAFLFSTLTIEQFVV